MTNSRAAERAAAAAGLGRGDLVLSHLTLPRATFEERVRAAARAGFAGIGLHVAGWKRLRREGATVADLAEVLDRHDILLVELEFLQGWAAGAEQRAAARVDEDLLYELADGLGARHLQLGGPYAGTVDDAAEAFAAVCDRAASHGLRVALEYLPHMTNIGSAAEALAIVERADRPNGGICVDSWHHERGPDTLADLAAIPGRRITSIQLDDGALLPAGHRFTADSYMLDTSTNRLPPGEGTFDLVGLLTTLATLDVHAPLGLEIISPTVAAGAPDEVARRVANGMNGVLARL